MVRLDQMRASLRPTLDLSTSIRAPASATSVSLCFVIYFPCIFLFSAFPIICNQNTSFRPAPWIHFVVKLNKQRSLREILFAQNVAIYNEAVFGL